MAVLQAGWMTLLIVTAAAMPVLMFMGALNP